MHSDFIVIGASVAFHLARGGAKNVLVLERDPASDPRASAPDLNVRTSYARATGGFRVQHGTDINVRLRVMARAELFEFEGLTGVDAGCVPSRPSDRHAARGDNPHDFPPSKPSGT